MKWKNSTAEEKIAIVTVSIFLLCLASIVVALAVKLVTFILGVN